MNSRGMAILWIGVFLFVLIGFAALAVDFAYMYFIKNMLQVAADSAALAGAGTITNPTTLNQPLAIQNATAMAQKNGIQPVDDGALPEDDLEITFGFWNKDNSTFAPNSTPVNAVKVLTRRTTSIFFGRIFGFARQTAAADAVAVAARPLAPFPLCIPQCGTRTPLVINSPNIMPGLRFLFKSDSGPYTGWTSYEIGSTSMPIARDFILGNRSITNACNICVNTTNGIQNPVFCAARQRIEAEKLKGSHIIYDGTGKAFPISGWRTLVPILSNVVSIDCQKTKSGCIGDPSYQPGDPFKVVKYADVVITDAIPQGSCPGDSGQVAGGDPGIVIVGATSGTGIANSVIDCADCSALPPLTEGVTPAVWLVD